jgi:hypothetical protein
MSAPQLQKMTPIVDKNGHPTQYFLNYLLQVIPNGFTGTITTAKLTTGGANGSITLVNGVVVHETAPS